ncbi:MAG: hypothetical protein HC796_04230 [Synechococcaceae cyanobacterium RL_1_2]|nr:hypothetical protein [Synechococcaceae cyanobacterium RL_1_2]
MQSLQSPQSFISIEELNQLNRVITAIASPFIGQPFGWVSVGYGDEIYLHFGPENITQGKSGKLYKEGELVLETFASCWELRQSKEVMLNDSVFAGTFGASNEIRLHDTFKRLTSKVLTGINIESIPHGIKTVFSFTEEFSFHLFPHPNNPNLPLWELFMATSQILTLENKPPFWSCHSSHDRY